MQSIGYSQLLAEFKPSDRKTLKFLTPLAKIEGLFSEESQQPENHLQNLYDPIDFYIIPKQDMKKRSSAQNSKQHHILLIGKAEKKESGALDHEAERKKTYKAGPFAQFYTINEGTLDKDAEVWYYKEHKDIVGPVSSYNMDKMVYYKKIDEETRVAYKSIEKFVKFGKIKKIVDEQKSEEKAE